MAKKWDVVCTTGTYEKDGQTKYLSKNVGEIIETKSGLSMKLDATFNPAGCKITDDGKIWLKLFEPRDNNQQQRQAPKAAPSPYSQDDGDMDADLPF